MNLFFSNPEFIRNARIQLRLGRAAAAAVICAVISVTAWAYASYTPGTVIGELSGGAGLFILILYFQITILVIGGGISCLQAVHREKDLNTFDYQRVTRLKSLELAAGKLFGAPVMSYFIVLCFMPVALLGAIAGQVPVFIIFEIYVLILLGSITYHALALMVSVLLGRGTTAISIFLFLALVGISSIDLFSNLSSSSISVSIHSLSPYFLGNLVPHAFSAAEQSVHGSASSYQWNDFFLGKPVAHPLVMVLLYCTFTAWFLLAIVRNLKRDPSIYEVYSPNQAFVFALYLNLLMLGFLSWAVMFHELSYVYQNQTYYTSPLATYLAEQQILLASLCFFVALGLVLMRNRERVRRRVRDLGNRAAGWWAAAWPAPYLIAGMALVGSAVIALISHYRNLGVWNLRLALFNITFPAVWLVRDILYLQWMNLRRAKRPLVTAFLYLIVFYISSVVIFSTLNLYRSPRSTASTAILIPGSALFVSPYMWSAEAHVLIAALVLQALEAMIFVWLHRMRLREFLVLPSPTPAPQPIAEVAQPV